MNIGQVAENAKLAYNSLKSFSNQQVAELLNTIAIEIENLAEAIVPTAMAETNLPETRLRGEIGRTCSQLRMFSQVAFKGTYMHASIDTAIPDRQPLPKPDIRSVNIGIGPIMVFGASNFPLAFSTAGGDTASALAAACPVIYKAHPAHLETSKLVASAIQSAVEKCGFPIHTFQHIVLEDFDAIKLLVQHQDLSAVAFTGSHVGGKAIHSYASERKNPIPVFAEMGSTNPIIFLGNAIAKDTEKHATTLANAITMGVGQFCTNPGLIFGIKSVSFHDFTHLLAEKMEETSVGKMLHAGIVNNFYQGLDDVLSSDGVIGLTKSVAKPSDNISANAFLAKTSGAHFIANPSLHKEVFGPFSLLVEFESKEELLKGLEALEGQLTATLIAEEQDLHENKDVLDLLTIKVGRLILNGVPTGVEVCHSMVHGGPYPATTDARFTSVGAQAILRWYRPICFQNMPESALPLALHNSNPLGLNRLVNGTYTQEKI